MSTAFPVNGPLLAKLYVSLVYKSRCLQRMPGTLATQEAVCPLSQFVIEKWKYIVCRRTFGLAPCLEHLGYLRCYGARGGQRVFSYFRRNFFKKAVIPSAEQSPL